MNYDEIEERLKAEYKAFMEYLKSEKAKDTFLDAAEQFITQEQLDDLTRKELGEDYI